MRGGCSGRVGGAGGRRGGGDGGGGWAGRERDREWHACAIDPTFRLWDWTVDDGRRRLWSPSAGKAGGPAPRCGSAIAGPPRVGSVAARGGSTAAVPWPWPPACGRLARESEWKGGRGAPALRRHEGTSPGRAPQWRRRPGRATSLAPCLANTLLPLRPSFVVGARPGAPILGASRPSRLLMLENDDWKHGPCARTRTAREV